MIRTRELNSKNNKKNQSKNSSVYIESKNPRLNEKRKRIKKKQIGSDKFKKRKKCSDWHKRQKKHVRRNLSKPNRINTVNWIISLARTLIVFSTLIVS